MAEVSLRAQVLMKVEQDEFNLITKALSGKLKGPDTVAAMELGLRLLEVRQRFLDDIARTSTGTLQKAREEFETLKAARQPKEKPDAEAEPGKEVGGPVGARGRADRPDPAQE